MNPRHEEPASTPIQGTEKRSQQSMYWQHKSVMAQFAPTTSTPDLRCPTDTMQVLTTPDVSEISTADTCSMSGVEELATKPHAKLSTEVSYVQPSHDSPEIPSTSSRHSKVSKTLPDSFIDPQDLQLSIEIDEDEINSDDDDSDYEPSFYMTLIADDNLPMNENSDDDDDDDDDDGDNTDHENEECPEESNTIMHVPGICRVSSEEDQDGLLSDTCCIVYLKQLLDLANTNISTVCTSCNGNVCISTEFVGSALYLKWKCQNGHLAHKWCSQPILNNRLHSGDLMTAVAILLSGNNYAKMNMFSKALSLKILCQSSYNNIQRSYLVPCIDKFWKKHQEQLCASFVGEELVLLGDGRMDSPGFCAQYCTYTFMENGSKKILSILTKDKRATDRKSTVLEKACFEESINQLQERGVNMKEMVTDAHIQIASLMKKNYPDMKHSFDIWHAAKNMTKKLVKAGKIKECKPLLKWTNSIVNHFWYCCRKATTKSEFLSTWTGVIHHVVNEHTWILGECDHGPLTETEDEKEYLVKDSPAHKALRNIVFEKAFLQKVHYFLNNRSTSDLESFHQLILMYASKRCTYSPPVYRVRNILAAIDHNVHQERELASTEDGRMRYHRVYNKKSCRWTVRPVKVKKTYPHFHELRRTILQTRLADNKGMRTRRELEPDDPRRLSTHLAPVSPPPTSTLVEQHVSRHN